MAWHGIALAFDSCLRGRCVQEQDDLLISRRRCLTADTIVHIYRDNLTNLDIRERASEQVEWVKRSCVILFKSPPFTGSILTPNELL
jgi:hypothetical protein